jgi:hypothetical protein
MALDVTDLVDLMRLLREHPDWKAALRNELLGDEILLLPNLVRENTVAIRELQDSVQGLERAVEGLVRSDDQTHRDLAVLKGDSLELHYFLHPHGPFGARIRKGRVVAPPDLEQFEDADEAGTITPAQALGVRKLDLIFAGREGRASDSRDALLAVKISWRVNSDDVTRAAERAATLRAVGYNAYPAVAGKLIAARDRDLALGSGVEVFVDEVTEPISSA